MNYKILYLLLLFILFNPNIRSQWIQQTNGLPTNWSNTSCIDACDNNTAVIGAYNPYILKTTDSGNSWISVPFPAFIYIYGGTTLYENVVDITIIDEARFWICTDAGRILATSDKGYTWNVQFYDTTKTPFMNYIKMFDVNNGIAMGDAADNHPAVFLSTTNGGSNWISENNSALWNAGSGDTWRRLNFVNPFIGYFYASGINPQQLLKTTNGGKNWLITNYPKPGDELIKFYDENLGLTVNYENKQWVMNRTTDGGNSWESFNTGSKEWPSDIEFIPGNPSKVWYADLGSLYYSQDTGRTWSEQKIYDGELMGRDLIFTDSTHGWLLCDGGRLYHTVNNGGIVTSISLNKDQLPSGFMLEQNYPNPFNPSTVISYRLSAGGRVLLKVYDILGRTAGALVDEYQSAGKHEAKFDAVHLPGGVYICILRAGNFSASRKMILLK